MKQFLQHSAFALVALIPLAVAAQTAGSVERGKYLVQGISACGNCHFQRGSKGEPLLDKGLSGGMLFDEAAFTAHAANITPDKDTGIGRWTDAQLAKSIREGVRPDKSLIGPPMPMTFYRHISDVDLAAIVAYLRAQPAVSHVVPKSGYNIPLPPSYGLAVSNVKTPPATDKVQYGQYLASLGHCMECHTPQSAKGGPDMARLGAGGMVFKGTWGESVAANLTPTGLKGWSDAQIISAIRTGVDREGKPLKPPMGFDFYKNVNDADMAALIAYLRSLKPQSMTAAR